MTTFVPPRDRDAWGTIAGFVYQVDVTIERWLSLKEGETLELERGEDIDLICCAIDQGDPIRILMQVKLRNHGISLRSPEVVCALAGFFEHYQPNPSLNLLFRYITNSTPVTERPSQLPAGITGITAWTRVFESEVADDTRGLLEGIRGIMLSSARPKALNPDTWARYRDFVERADDNQMLAFIKRVDWSVGNVPSQQIGPLICSRLHNSGFARTDEEAQSLYDTLFAHVFRLLSAPGIKRLTRADLGALVDNPRLSVADRAAIDRINSVLADFETRLSRVERDAATHGRALSQIGTTIDALAERVGLAATIDYRCNTFLVEAPPLVTPHCLRSRTVTELLEALGTKTWTTLNGDKGVGKTHLVLLLAQRIGGHKVWVRLRDVPLSLVGSRLALVLARSSHLEPSSSWRDWTLRVCKALRERGSVLILEDLPLMIGDCEFADQLVILAQSCREAGVKMLCTSLASLPTFLRSRMGEDHTEVRVPGFSDEDIREFLQVSGAPEGYLRDGPIALLAHITKRHPMLLAACVRFMQSTQWSLADGELMDVLSGGYRQEVNREAQAWLMATVPDPVTREFLYRMTAFGSPFSLEDAQSVCSVQPAVSRPLERLASVLGSWIQQESKDTFVTSPLLGDWTWANLGSVVLEIHRAIGFRILSRRLLEPVEVIRAIGHFNNALDFDMSGIILLRVLNQVHNERIVKDEWGLTLAWGSLPLPSGMRLSTRIMIRGLQVAVFHRLGRDPEYVLKDLDDLIQQATEEDLWAVCYSTIMAGPLQAEYDPVSACHFLGIALRAFPNARMPDGAQLCSNELLRPEPLVWLIAACLRTESDLEAWLRIILAFDAQQLKIAVNDSAFEDAWVMS